MHDAMDPDSLRKINYELSEDFLRLPNARLRCSEFTRVRLSEMVVGFGRSRAQ